MPFEQRSPYPLSVDGAQCSAPAVPGVYGLVNASRWIYIGQADNLQEALLRHLQSSGDSVLKWGPTGFVFETCSGQRRQARKDSLVLEYAPICNVGAAKPTDEDETPQEKKDWPLRFILKGFSQDKGVRRYEFDGIAEDYGRSAFTVLTDLNLIRVYGIPMQELPLLCREFLEGRADHGTERQFVFAEDDMRKNRDRRLAAKDAAAQRKKGPRRPPTANLGNAWRTSIQPSARNGA